MSLKTLGLSLIVQYSFSINHAEKVPHSKWAVRGSSYFMNGKPQVSYHLLLRPVYSAVLGYSKGLLWNSKHMKYSGYTVSGTSLIYISDCYSVMMTVPDPGRKKT